MWAGCCGGTASTLISSCCCSASPVGGNLGGQVNSLSQSSRACPMLARLTSTAFLSSPALRFLLPDMQVHRGKALRGYIAMLTVEKPYRYLGVGESRL